MTESLEDIVDFLATDQAVAVVSLQRGESEPSLEERRSILAHWAAKDLGLFLEKWGSHLRKDHLLYFAEIPDASYEMRWHTSRLLANFDEKARHRSASNRRFEFMGRLEREGDYFSDAAMQRRNPSLYESMLGKHLTKAQRHTLGLDRRQDDASDFPNMPLVDMFAKAAQGANSDSHRFEEVYSDEEDDEEDDDEDDDEDDNGKRQDATVSHSFSHPDSCAMDADDDDADDDHDASGFESEHDSDSEDERRSDHRSAMQADRGAALRSAASREQERLNRIRLYREYQYHDYSQPGPSNSGARAAFGAARVSDQRHIPANADAPSSPRSVNGQPEELAGFDPAVQFPKPSRNTGLVQESQRAELKKIMRQHFLDGLDKEVDYAAIDADETLDNYELAERDEEEEFFDRD